jgi:hypothetical protein
MGKRGPKPRFLDVACPNEKCTLFGPEQRGTYSPLKFIRLLMSYF